MRTTFFAVALCAATAIAAPRGRHLSKVVDKVESGVSELESSLRPRHVPQTGRKLVHEVENEVSDLVSRDVMDEAEDEVDSLTSSLGVRAPLDTSVVGEVEDEVDSLTQLDTSNLSVRDDTALLDKVVNHVDKIVDLNIPSADKLQRILNTIVDEIQARDAAEKRSASLSHISFPGLDLSALDSASVDELLSDLCVLLQRLVQVVDPSEVSTVMQLIDELNDTISEVGNDLGLSKRGLLALNLPAIDSLDLDSLVDDVEALVAYAEKAVIKEVRSVSPSLAKEIKGLLKEVSSITSSL